MSDAPSSLPRECCRADGRPKLRYFTRAQAKAAIKSHSKAGTPPVHLYRCHHCGYFHLGTDRP